jgi:hypothetical protein
MLVDTDRFGRTRTDWFNLKSIPPQPGDVSLCCSFLGLHVIVKDTRMDMSTLISVSDKGRSGEVPGVLRTVVEICEAGHLDPESAGSQLRAGH